MADLWFSYGGRNRQVLEQLVAKFNARWPASHIHPVFQGDYYEGLAKLRLAAAARAVPSVSHVVAEVIPYLVEVGILEPLSDYPGARDIEPIPQLGQQGTWAREDSKGLWCLPFNRSTPIAFLDGELIEQQRLTPPVSWQELRETARALTQRHRGTVTRYGFECPVSWWFWSALVYQAGGDLVDENGTVTLGGQAGIRALELWQKMVHVDASMKPPPRRDANANEMVNSDYLSRRVPMIWTSTAFLKYFEDNAGFPVRAAPLPAGVRRGVPTGGTFFVLLRDASLAGKKVAWHFLRFMLETEQVVEWSTSTGYLPTTLDAVRALESQGFYERHPNFRVALEQLAFARPWPWAPQLFRVEREVLAPLIERAVLEGINAAALVNDAYRRVKVRRSP